MFSYMPWLALVGILAGLIVGFAVNLILRALPSGLMHSLVPNIQQTAQSTAPKAPIKKVKVVVVVEQDQPQTDDVTQVEGQNE